MRKLVSVFVMALFLFSVVGCANQAAGPAKSSEALRIGVTYPLSGSLAKPGQDSFNGAEIARQMVNDAGGVNGRQVEYVKSDTPDATAAVSEANRLISQTKVKIILGSYSSPNALAMSEITEKNKVIFWETASMDNSITGRGYKYVFRTNPNAEMYAVAAVDYLNNSVSKLLHKSPAEMKTALIYEDGSFGQSTAAVALTKLQSYGFPVVAKESYSSKVLDLSSLVMKLKEAKPDVIVAVQYNNDAILFWKQARDLGLNVQALIGNGAGHSNDEFVKSRGKDAEGILVSSPPSSSKVESLPTETQKIYQDFVKRYKEKFGTEPPTQALTSFAGAWILLHDVLPKASDPNDVDKVRQAALGVSLPEGSEINGWGVKFTDNGQNTSSFSVIMQWQNGKVNTIYPEKYAQSTVSSIPLIPWEKR